MESNHGEPYIIIYLLEGAAVRCPLTVRREFREDASFRPHLRAAPRIGNAPTSPCHRPGNLNPGITQQCVMCTMCYVQCVIVIILYVLNRKRFFGFTIVKRNLQPTWTCSGADVAQVALNNQRISLTDLDLSIAATFFTCFVTITG